MARDNQHSAFPGLKGEQAAASHPLSSDVWLSASAGTGKTQVLTARVLRLLLHGARPEALLCLTFTKAGAAEMANRINEILGAWVRLPDGLLAKDLMALGEDYSPDARAGARALFARVLDARGGGLRIQTIHSFCQSLLAGFPSEAELIPGFRAIEGREEAALAQTVLADLVAGAEGGGDLGLIDRLRALSHRMGEDGARAMLARCAAAPDAMEQLGIGIEQKVRNWLGLGDVDPEALLLAACTDGGFDRAALEAIRQANLDWGTGRALEKVEAITDWLAMTPMARQEHILLLTSVWAKADGELKSLGKGWAPQEPGYEELITAQFSFFNGLLELCRLAETAAALTNALIVGQAYARAYADAKRAAGVVDFNDLIRHTVRLLEAPGMGDWIRYKLDQSTEHILVDEAQDTNANQWEIVKALAGEFYAGAGAKGEVLRTLFTVGDYKQAIFGFQGTDPQEFEAAKGYFSALAGAAEREVLAPELSQSFRSSQPILDVVDRVIEAVSPAAMGLQSPPQRHNSAKGGSGSVTLWPPVTNAPNEAEDAEEGWLANSELKFAADLADRVRGWTTGGLRLRNQARDATPGDVLILVRKRGDLARTIVSRLYEAGVPVAGVDRLMLDAPIAVKDLLACVRFVLQPEDDLNLAALLVSPLVGWSQDELYDRAKQRRGALWQHLGEHKPEALVDLLNAADLATPHRFLEAILSGSMQGRRKLIARLGEEARDPIEELLNQALAFERESAPSLQLFIDWFDRGSVEIKRDAGGPGGAVRVMTIHGAKGLQAPVVVLADATSDPDFKTSRSLDWVAEEGLSLPVFRPRKSELAGSLKSSAEQADARELEEHWRLLYVALTRAEEHLFIGGALKPRQQKGMGENCWHVQVERAMASVSADESGARLLALEEAEPKPGRAAQQGDAAQADEPAWLRRPAPGEARPPRPLAPSAILPPDTVSEPPPGAAMRKAAIRGVLLHGLFERLPAIAPDRRAGAADRWLRGAQGVTEDAERADFIRDALAVLDDQRFAPIFAPDALAEAPVAGVVDGQVISGTVDRLLVAQDRVLVVDFKTGRRVPQDADAVSPHHKAQMAAYVAVIRGIFPDRPVRAALLYTSGPALIELGEADLAAHKPGYRAQQDNLADAG